MRVAYIGEDIDAAKELASWLVMLADGTVSAEDEQGVDEAKQSSDHQASDNLNVPQVELFIYAGIDHIDLATAIAFACEGVWAHASFAGMAHVVPERHNALLGAHMVIDALDLSFADASQTDKEHETLAMDAAFLAPEARIIRLSKNTTVHEFF